MITQVTVQNFKRYQDPTEFNLKPEGVTFLAGGNNSGKSSLLQAMAVWEFCRSVIEQEKGDRALRSGYSPVGVGINAEEFSPVALPDLKHLWHNLRVGTAGYNLKLKCQWDQIAEGQPPQPRHLEFSLALANDRLFIKPSSSSLPANCSIPRMAYLPPFAGITPKEEKMSPAARKRLIGRGVAGAILRNMLYDLWAKNVDGLNELRNLQGRISPRERADFRKNDSWERLAETLIEVFKIGLTVEKFNELYHTTIKVALFEGDLINARFRKRNGFSPRDIMAEGSGFLQWLSVYALAVNSEIDVLLLDEPDAHLHPTLQGHLTFKLKQLAVQNKKQVLVATHSTTILSESEANSIYRMETGGYLSNETDRVRLFIGLGSAYAPRLDQLKRCKRLLLHDGPSDINLLKRWMAKLGQSWPGNLVGWEYTNDHDARIILFRELKDEMPNLKALSIQDRDDTGLGKVAPTLTFGTRNTRDLELRMWKRRNIENYLLVPSAIARAAGVNVADIEAFLAQQHGIAIQAGQNFTAHCCLQVLANADGKRIISTEPNSVCTTYGLNYWEIAEAMNVCEIADDVKVLIQQIQDLCQ